MSDQHFHTHNLGYPRIGERRELRKATKSVWFTHTATGR